MSCSSCSNRYNSINTPNNSNNGNVYDTHIVHNGHNGHNVHNVHNVENEREHMSQCQVDAYGYANKQNTFYDEKKNQILYGRSNLMRVSGVSDGTCNQINPLMLKLQSRCGTGAAGGNPCYPDTVEPFDQNGSNQGCDISGFVTMLFLILILLLFININYYENQ